MQDFAPFTPELVWALKTEVERPPDPRPYSNCAKRVERPLHVVESYQVKKLRGPAGYLFLPLYIVNECFARQLPYFNLLLDILMFCFYIIISPFSEHVKFIPTQPDPHIVSFSVDLSNNFFHLSKCALKCHDNPNLIFLICTEAKSKFRF